LKGEYLDLRGRKWRDAGEDYNEEPRNLYASPSVISMIKSWRMRLAVHVARMVAMRNAYKIWVGRPEIKRPSGRRRRRWEVNVRMDLDEYGG